MQDIRKIHVYFDAEGAENFVEEWNRIVNECGAISVYEVLNNVKLLGTVYDEFVALAYDRYGWKAKKITVVSAFKVVKGNRNYYYKLKLPKKIERLR